MLRGQGVLARKLRHIWLTAIFVVLAAAPTAVAGDRTNIPLKNWGGFSEFQDAVYEDLERLVTAGLADRVLLNTRPLSRIEAAKIVARAIEKIRSDEMGRLNARRDLEPVLDRLMEEFKVELASLGVRTSEGAVAPPGVVSFTPVDRAQTFLGYASRQFSLVNDQGHTFKRGANGGRKPCSDRRLLHLLPPTRVPRELGLWCGPPRDGLREAHALQRRAARRAR
jgi:hypothetical protein